jgi:hypothetical protein
VPAPAPVPEPAPALRERERELGDGQRHPTLYRFFLSAFSSPHAITRRQQSAVHKLRKVFSLLHGRTQPSSTNYKRPMQHSSFNQQSHTKKKKKLSIRISFCVQLSVCW